MSVLRSAQLIAYATAEYVAERIDIDELEDRIHRALTGEETDQEWIDASRHHRWTSPHSGLASLYEVDSVLKAAYCGPIRER